MIKTLLTPGVVPFEGLKSFESSWQILLFNNKADQAFLLKFSLLKSVNGFKQIARIDAIYFNRQQHHIKNLRKFFPTQEVTHTAQEEIWFQSNMISRNQSKGECLSFGQKLTWNLHFEETKDYSFQGFPAWMLKSKLRRQQSLSEKMWISGKVHLDYETILWKHAQGIFTNTFGNSSDHSWITAHCQHFLDEHHQEVRFHFEGSISKAQVGPFLSPTICAFNFQYLGETISFSSMQELFHFQSTFDADKWHFKITKGKLHVIGKIWCDPKDLIGFAEQDTREIPFYRYCSPFAHIELIITFSHQKPLHLYGHQCCFFESGTRNKNRYVQNNH